MPIAFIVIGLLLIICGIQNTQSQLFTQVNKDFSGPGSFLYWLAVIVIAGAFGYIQSLRTLSRYFIALVVLVLFLRNGGAWQNLVSALNAPTPNTAPSEANVGAATPDTAGSASLSGSSGASAAGSAAATITGGSQ